MYTGRTGVTLHSPILLGTWGQAVKSRVGGRCHGTRPDYRIGNISLGQAHPGQLLSRGLRAIRQVIFSIDRLSEYHARFIFHRTAMLSRPYTEFRFYRTVKIVDCNTCHSLTIHCLYSSIL